MALEPLLLRYFTTYLADIPDAKRTSVIERFDRALHIEFTGILVGALDEEMFWTERSILLNNVKLYFLM